MTARLAIFNAYPSEARRDFDKTGVPQAHLLFLDVFRRRFPEASCEVFFPADTNEELPSRLDDFDGFLWTGSNGTVYKESPGVKRQLDLVRAMLQLDRPVWGSCWGLQLAAQASGGEVHACPAGREWMLARNVKLNEAGIAHEMFRGKPPVFSGLVMHLDEVCKTPAGAVVLASNHHSPVQAMELIVGKCSFWSTQYHPEYTLLTMAKLMKSRTEALVREGHFPGPEAVVSLADKLIRISDLSISDHGCEEYEALRIELGLDDSVLNADLKEREIINWIEFRLKPFLSRK